MLKRKITSQAKLARYFFAECLHKTREEVLLPVTYK